MKKSILQTPIGFLEIKANEKGVYSLNLISERGNFVEDKNDIIIQAEKELQEYFDGNRIFFTFKLNFSRGTEFQKKVWSTLLDIPYGKIVTYKEIAEKINNPKSYRAVGNANNKNPLPIIIPCHRVIGSNDSFTGYALGLDIKKYLLNLETK